MAQKLRRVEGGRYSFYCPGCGHHHVIPTAPPDGWEFNGDMERPTFKPSLLNTSPGDIEHGGSIPPTRCHLHVVDGVLQFCPDSKHAYAGLSVLMGEEAD